jgi:hypothetical protein
MHYLIVNPAGFAMLAVAFAAAFAIGYLVGTSAEGILMIVASPFLVGADVVYRATRATRQWFHPHGGGMLFFVPIWVWGVVWLLLGIGYTMTR